MYENGNAIPLIKKDIRYYFFYLYPLVERNPNKGLRL